MTLCEGHMPICVVARPRLPSITAHLQLARRLRAVAKVVDLPGRLAHVSQRALVYHAVGRQAQHVVVRAHRRRVEHLELEGGEQQVHLILNCTG